MPDPTFAKDQLDQADAAPDYQLDQADAAPDWGDHIPFDGAPAPTLPKTVELTWPQWYVAAQVGLLRYITSRQKGLEHKYGYNGHGAIDDIQAAAAEFATSLAMNISWQAGVNTFKDPDNGEYTQVRVTKHEDGCLIVRKEDPDTHRYVLVIQEAETRFSVVGWIWGGDAKQEQWLTAAGNNNRPRAYFVPQQELSTW